MAAFENAANFIQDIKLLPCQVVIAITNNQDKLSELDSKMR